jgi:hypothetical protein
MVERAQCQVAFEVLKGLLHLRQLNVVLPELARLYSASLTQISLQNRIPPVFRLYSARIPAPALEDRGDDGRLQPIPVKLDFALEA